MNNIFKSIVFKTGLTLILVEAIALVLIRVSDRYIVSTFMLSLLMTAFVIYLSFQKIIVLRINEILEVLKRVEAGDLAARVRESTTQDEIDQLQRGFNTIADKLQETIKALKLEIAEEKQMAEALHKTKTLFHSMIEGLPQNIFTKDLKGRFVFANQRYCETERRALEDILGKTDFDLHPPELAQKYQADDRKVIETGQLLNALEEHQSIGREKFYVQVIKAPIYDHNGSITGIMGIFWDITNHKEAEEALRRSEERFRNLVENAPLGIISIDTQGQVMDINLMLVAMLGLPSIEAAREINFLTFPSLVKAGITEDIRQCLATGMPMNAEHLYVSEWEKQVYLRYYLTPIRSDNGSVIGAQAIIEDITESKWVENALKESEAEYRSLFKNMSSGLAYHKIIVDEHEHPVDYIFLQINEAYERLTGLTREIIGKRVTEVIPEIQTLEPNLITTFGNVALTGKEITFDLYFEPFGVWYSVSAYSPEIGYFVALYDDITERKWAEESLRKLNEELEQRVDARTIELKNINKELQESLETLRITQDQLVQSEKMAALGGLVAGVAHEINTPLGIGVTAASHLHHKTVELQEFYHDGKMKRTDLEYYLKTANDSTEMILGNLARAAELIQGFKQVAVDQTTWDKRKFKLRDYIDKVLINLQPKLKRTKHSVMVNCPEELELDSYPGAFSQIITNLVINSLTHGFEDIEKGEIVFEVIPKGTTLMFRYRDNGKGISENELKRIFEPFYTTKRHQGGTGLGLHIVYNLVTQRLKGQIMCESTPGNGAMFTIQMPLYS